eukprot:SAG25_NODE_10851_length_321_cov_0.923423_1_plen_70_part_01
MRLRVPMSLWMALKRHAQMSLAADIHRLQDFTPTFVTVQCTWLQVVQLLCKAEVELNCLRPNPDQSMFEL